MELEKEDEKMGWKNFKSGFSQMSFLAILYAMVLFIPAQIYLTLMTGSGGFEVSWFTLLLWIEFAKLSGRKIAKQEAFMILMLTGTAIYIPLGMVYNTWFRAASPQAAFFNIGPYVPDWIAPAPETRILQLRTFIHPAWITPLAVNSLSILFGAMFSLGLGFFTREAYLETERLPFPMQNVDAEAILTLTGEDEGPIRRLSIFALFGFAYGFILYALPFLYQAWTGIYIQTIPVPWVDLSYMVERSLPGAMFGIFTDLGPIAGGIVLTGTAHIGLPYVIAIVIGSFAAYFIGPWLSVAYNLVDVDPVKPGAQSWWLPKMSIALAMQRYLLYFYTMYLIGFSLAVGIGPILRHPGVLRKTLSSIFKPKLAKRFTQPISNIKITLLLVGGSAGFIILFWTLVPDFVAAVPWFIPLMIATPFLNTLVVGRMIGETGISGGFPAGDIKNLVYYTSGYQGVDIWFAPTCMGTDGTGWLTNFRVAELTETTVESMIKMYVLVLPIAIPVGLLFLELFWKIAPIPSGRYPGVAIFWPIDATMQSLWIRGKLVGLFRPLPIAASFATGIGIYLALNLLHAPVSFIPLAAGLGTPTPIAVTIFIGAIIALVLRRVYGKEWLNKYKLTIAAGLMIGEAIAISIGLAVALIITSVWTPPF